MAPLIRCWQVPTHMIEHLCWTILSETRCGLVFRDRAQGATTADCILSVLHWAQYTTQSKRNLQELQGIREQAESLEVVLDDLIGLTFVVRRLMLLLLPPQKRCDPAVVQVYTWCIACTFVSGVELANALLCFRLVSQSPLTGSPSGTCTLTILKGCVHASAASSRSVILF